MNDLSRRFAARFAVLVLGVLFSFLVIEAMLRLVGYVYSREDKPPVTARADALRILCIGNSFTYGSGAPKGMGYPEQLERLLNAVGPGRYQVLNRGIRNANSSIVAENVPGWMERDRPHVVFAMVGEPNKWNKYGYWEYRRRATAAAASALAWLEPLRFLRTFRLLELLLNRSESWNRTDDEVYSTTFRSVRKDSEADKLLLAYLWLGAIDGGYFRSHELPAPALAEATELLDYLVRREPANAVAGRLYAELLVARGLTGDEFLRVVDAAAALQNGAFSYPLWRIFRDLERRRPELFNARLRARKATLEAGFSARKLAAISTHFQSYTRSTLHLPRPVEVLFDMVNYHPSNPFILFQLSKNAAPADLPRVTAAAVRGLALNPLSPNIVYLNVLLQRTARIPALRAQIEAQLRRNSEKFGGIDFGEILEEDRVDEGWLVADLERIIAGARAVGARVVMQTYPPLRKGGDRPVDRVLRKWWADRTDKDGLEFLDVTARLTELYRRTGDRERFYSMEVGPDDQHLNAEGYGEVAKLMLPVVTRREAPAVRE
jgi:lysophospholipase L1-like esterase